MTISLQFTVDEKCYFGRTDFLGLIFIVILLWPLYPNSIEIKHLWALEKAYTRSTPPQKNYLRCVAVETSRKAYQKLSKRVLSLRVRVLMWLRNWSTEIVLQITMVFKRSKKPHVRSTPPHKSPHPHPLLHILDFTQIGSYHKQTYRLVSFCKTD